MCKIIHMGESGDVGNMTRNHVTRRRAPSPVAVKKVVVPVVRTRVTRGIALVVHLLRRGRSGGTRRGIRATRPQPDPGLPVRVVLGGLAVKREDRAGRSPRARFVRGRKGDASGDQRLE